MDGGSSQDIGWNPVLGDPRDNSMDIDNAVTHLEIRNNGSNVEIRRARSRSPLLFFNENTNEELLNPDDNNYRNDAIISLASNNSSNENLVPELKLEEKPLKEDILNASDDSDYEEGQVCSICFDVWTNSGSHRLTSLKCGHLFGHSCIKRWLTGDQKDKYCPTCKSRATMRDLRFIYAKKLIALDTFERDQLSEQLEKVTAEKCRLELECRVQTLSNQVLTKKIEEYKQRIERLTTTVRRDVNVEYSRGSRTIYLEKTIDITTEPTCRVLSYNNSLNQIAVSQLSQSTIFPGYGVKIVDMSTFKPLQFVHLGAKIIRDISFNPLNTDRLLSASLDKSARIYDMLARSVVQTVNTEEPLWACGWDVNNNNYFYLGTQSGSVSMYDSRNIYTCLNTFQLGDRSPVIALSGVKSNAGTPLCQGGFLCCKLNSCWAVEMRNSNHVMHMLPFEGPFTSLSYDNGTGQLLISSRPSQKHSKIRHIVSVLDKSNEAIIPNIIHTFNGGNFQKLMSRSNQIVLDDDTLIAAHSDEAKGINIWSVKSGTKIKCLPSPETFMDICPVSVNNDNFITGLSETKLRIYRIVE